MTIPKEEKPHSSDGDAIWHTTSIRIKKQNLADERDGVPSPHAKKKKSDFVCHSAWAQSLSDLSGSYQK
jgi:hypothetical protein